MKLPKTIASHIGERHGRLTVVSYAGPHQSPDRTRHKWRCLCDCGNTVDILASNLTRNHSRSCGCLKNELTRERETTHGMSDTPECGTWVHIRQRCCNPNSLDYPDYGGRGITVCERWMNSFENFYRDMGDRPSPEHMIERIDNDAGYSPDNCIWATIEVQANNKRTSHRLTHNGETHTVTEWSRILNINQGTLEKRIRSGWPIHRAFDPTMHPPGKLSMIEFQGEKHHMSEWARRIGITPNALWKRINVYGWSVERALTTPLRPKSS